MPYCNFKSASQWHNGIGIVLKVMLTKTINLGKLPATKA